MVCFECVDTCGREGGIEVKMRRWMFFGLWVLSLAAITFYGGAVSYGFFFGMSLLPLVCLGYMVCVYCRFKIYQEIGSRTMVCGRPESFLFILKNEDFFAYASVSIGLFSDFSYVEDLPGDTEYELLPGDRYAFETRLVCRYRGEYEVGVKEVLVRDFLGLFRIRYRNPGTVKALVSPRVISLEELRSLGEFQAALLREAPGSTEPDVVVRDYVPGDPLKQVHWKATAREGKLKVRTRTGEEKQEICIFCDMTRHSGDRNVYLPLENKMLEVLLALGFFLAGKEMAFSVCYGQGGPLRRQVRGMREFEAFYREVDGVVFDREEDGPETLERMLSGGMFRDARVGLFIFHELNEKIMELSGRLAEGGLLTVLYAVTDRSQEVYIRQGGGRRKIVQVPLDAVLEVILWQVFFISTRRVYTVW